MTDTDKTWQYWGEADPYLGVATDEKFRGAHLERHRAEFFQSGRDYIDTRMALARSICGDVATGTALDFGLRCWSAHATAGVPLSARNRCRH